VIGKPLPPNVTGEEWLRGRRNFYVFAAFCVLCLTGVVIFAMAATKSPTPPPPVSWIGRTGWAYYEESDGEPTEYGVLRPLGAATLPHYAGLQAGTVLESTSTFRLRSAPTKGAHIIAPVAST
jgi:hypothetical protein